jgi:hypothetical protein
MATIASLSGWNPTFDEWEKNMGVIHREPSPAQQASSRANGKHSHGPRTERGKRNSRRNVVKRFGVDAKLLFEELNEDPAYLEKLSKELRTAMQPRDNFEATLVDSIVLLQSRLNRLHRAELGVISCQRRHLANQRPLNGLHRGGVHGTTDSTTLALTGHAGMADSVEKFEMLTRTFRMLLQAVEGGHMDGVDTEWIDIVYGKLPGLAGARLKVELQRFLDFPEDGDTEKREVAKDDLVFHLRSELGNWNQLATIFMDEQLGMAVGRSEADLLPPADELDKIIRYESHLERQIERKLRQFYVRRRELVCPEPELLPAAVRTGRPMQLFRAAGASTGGFEQE